MSNTEQNAMESQKAPTENNEDDRNKKHKEGGLSLSDRIQLAIAIGTLFSVIAVFVTLFFSQKATNMAYKPYIVMNPVNITFDWNSGGYQTWLMEISNVNKKSTIEQEEQNGEITGKITIPLTFLTEDNISKYSVVNIGVGTARDIVFSWDTNNLTRINDHLIEIDDKFIGFFEEGEKQDCFQIGDALLFTNKIQDSAMMYMLPEAAESWDLYFPVQYRILIEELIKHMSLKPAEFPLVILSIDCKDIQGKDYQQLIAVRVKLISYFENEDGSGGATYQLSPVNGE